MNAADYFAIDAVNFSSLKYLPDDPPLYAEYFVHRLSEPDYGDEANKGIAVHAVLSGGAEPFTVIPQEVLAVNGAKSGGLWKDFAAEHEGEILLKQHEADEVNRMVDSIMAEPRARWLVEQPGHAEHSLLWTEPATEAKCKGRIDKIAVPSGEAVVGDFKTTNDPSERGFRKAITDQQYHRQAAWYFDGVLNAMNLEPVAFMFVAVRNKPPFDCHVYELEPQAISLGRDRNLAALIDLKRRTLSGDWNHKDHGKIRLIDVQPWAYQQREELFV